MFEGPRCSWCLHAMPTRPPWWRLQLHETEWLFCRLECLEHWVMREARLMRNGWNQRHAAALGSATSKPGRRGRLP